MRYKFHHIAIACFDINKTISKYEVLGYEAGDIQWDNIQKASICFLMAEGMPTIELISSKDDQSPIRMILKKNGVIPYHTCYLTDNLQESIEILSKKGFTILTNPVKAIALNNKKIVFIYSSDSGLIELFEK